MKNKALYIGISSLLLLSTLGGAAGAKSSEARTTNRSNLIAAAPAKDNSSVTKKEFKVGSFDTVNIKGGFRAILKQGSGPKVVVECNKNSLEKVKVGVKDGALNIYTAPNFNASAAALEITTPKLARLNTSGFVTARVLQYKGGNLEINGHNSSTVESTGSVDKLLVSCDGKAYLNLNKLISKECVANVADQSFAKLYASNTISASAKGKSVINVSGNPRVLKKNIASTSFFKVNK